MIVHNYRYALRGRAATRVFLGATGKTLGLSLEQKAGSDERVNWQVPARCGFILTANYTNHVIALLRKAAEEISARFRARANALKAP
jgi:hypothetical protein